MFVTRDPNILRQGVVCVCVCCLSPQFFVTTFVDECDGVTLKMHAEVLVGLHEKCLLLLSSFNKNCYHMPNFSISVLY